MSPVFSLKLFVLCIRWLGDSQASAGRSPRQLADKQLGSSARCSKPDVRFGVFVCVWRHVQRRQRRRQGRSVKRRLGLLIIRQYSSTDTELHSITAAMEVNNNNKNNLREEKEQPSKQGKDNSRIGTKQRKGPTKGRRNQKRKGKVSGLGLLREWPFRVLKLFRRYSI